MFMIVTYSILAVLFFVFYYWYNRDIFNPCLIFSVFWCVTAAISCRSFTYYLSDWCLKTHVVVLLSIFSFWAGSLFCVSQKKKKIYKKCDIQVSRKSLYLLYALTLICFVCYFIEKKNSGFLNITSNIERGDLKNELGNYSVSGFHYGSYLLPFLAIVYVFLIYMRIKFVILHSLIVALVVFVIVFFDCSRGTLLFLFLGAVFIHSRFYNFSISFFAFFFLGMILILIGLMLIRINTGLYGLVYETLDNPYLSCLYTYVAPNYANLNGLILLDLDHNYMGCGSFLALWRLLGIREMMYGQCVWLEILDCFNARPYVYAFYQDYGMCGVVVFPFFLGVFLSWLYGKGFSSPEYVLPLAFMQKAIIFNFFGNYFFGEFILLFPYLVSFVLIHIIKFDGIHETVSN